MDTTTLALFKKLESRIRDVDIRQGGPRGPKGRKGDRGLIGPSGAKGDQGPHGGAKGQDGTQGATGQTGPQGRSGHVGAQGPHGAAGPSGLRGASGLDGQDGVGISDATIDFDGHLTLQLTDGTEIDAGLIQMSSEGDITYIAGGGVPDKYKDDLEQVIEDLNNHLGDFNNPHQVTHAQLPDVAPDDHHPQLHDLESHTDVSIVGLLDGHGLWWNGTEWVNRSAFLETWPTGLANGGELNIGPGVNDIEVIGGVGVVVDSYTTPNNPPVVLALTWDQINTPITAAPAVAGSIVWFTIFDTGVAGLPINNVPANVGDVRQYAQAPSPTLARQEIPLGFAVHDGLTWQEVSNPKVINQTAETLREYITSVQQLTTIIEGGVVSEQALFTLDQAAGTVWENNRNWHVDKSDPNREALPAVTPMVFEYVNRDFSTVGGLTSTVDPNIWDNAGVVEPTPGPANTTTIQRVYLDPANHYWILLGQVTYPNFLTAQANLPANEAVVPYLLQNSILLGYIIAEKAKTDWDIDESVFVSAGAGGGSGGGGTPITDHNNLNGIGPDDHHTQAHFLYGPDHSDINIVPALAATQLLQQPAPVGPWEVDYRNKFLPFLLGQTYYPQQWVTDQDYISIANTETTDEAFPQNVGPPTRTYPDPNPFLTAANTSQVRSGHTYTFTASGLTQALWVWVPELTNDVRYSVVTIRDPNGSPIITRRDLDNASLNVDAWSLVGSDSVLYTAGTELVVYLEAQNFGSATQVTGGWVSEGQQNTAPPPAQNWNHNNAQSIVRIDKTDLNTTDRTAELLGIISGSTMLFAETAVPTSSRSYLVLAPPVDQGTYIEYSVSLQSSSGIITDGQNSTLTADVPVSQSTEFGFETDKWLAGEPNWATIESFLQYDGVTQAPGPDVGYGIDIQFQEQTASPDWDLISIGGGGGGGGGGDFTPAVFAGAGTSGYVPDPITETGRWLKDDGLWSTSVEVAGDVGIGTASPLRRLHVAATEQIVATFKTTHATSGGIGIADANTTATSGLAIRASGDDMWFGTGSGLNERMRINSAGRVGIGESTQIQTALDIKAAPWTINGYNAVAFLKSTEALAAGVGGGLLFGGAYTGTSITEFGQIQGFKENGTDGNFAGALALSTRLHGGGMVEAMRIDSTGSVGIGTTTPLNIVDQTFVSINASFAGGVELLSGGVQRARFESSVFGTVLSSTGTIAMIFQTNGLERERIASSGDHYWGGTSTPTGAQSMMGWLASNSRLNLSFNGTAYHNMMFFQNNNGTVGNINTNGSATQYVTTSDYRLKENEVPLLDAVARVGELKPYRFNFKADPTTTVDGFFAHEAQTVVPEAVCGIKDEIDEEGEMVRQGIDQAKLVPLLTAAIQELTARLEALENTR